MKRITTTLFFLSALMTAGHAQEVLKHKWHRFYIGGDKGYFVKTSTFTHTSMTEDQFGSGSTFDNSPMEIKVAKLYTTAADERVITDYGDSSYYVLVFKNFTSNKAAVCMNTEAFKTIEEAETYSPADTEFTDWFTEAGYALESKKPVMPEMTKKDAIAFMQYLTKAIADIKKAVAEKASDDKEMDGLAFAMIISTVPAKFAETKGYNAYKSIPVIQRGMNKFKNDPEIKKLMSATGLPDGE